MTCEKIQEHHLDYIEQALNPAQVSEFEAHIRHCAHCAHELAMLRWTRQAVRSLPSLAAPADLRQRVQAQLWRERGTPPVPFWRAVRERLTERLRSRRWALPASVATAVAAVLLVAVALPSLYNRSLEEQRASLAPPVRQQSQSASPSPAAPAERNDFFAQRGGLPHTPERPDVHVEIKPHTKPRTPSASGGGFPPMHTAPPSSLYSFRPGETNIAPRQRPPQYYGQRSPYANDIRQPHIQQMQPGETHLNVHRPSEAPAPPEHQPNTAPGGKSPLLAARPPQDGHDRKTQEREETAATAGGATLSGSAGGGKASPAPAPEVDMPVPDALKGQATAPPHTAKVNGEEKTSTDDRLNREPPPTAVMPPGKPAPSDVETVKKALGIASPLRVPTTLTLSVGRLERITLYLQPDTDLPNAAVTVILPSTMLMRGMPRPGSRMGIYTVYKGSASSKHPVPVPFQVLPFAVGRHVIQVTLRSPALPRPVTEKMVVQVVAGRVGR